MDTNQPPVSRVANRYGTPKPGLSRRTWKRLIWITLGVAVLATAVFSVQTAIPEVSSKDVGFNIQDAGRASVDYEITKAPETAVQCAIQVLSETYAVVGWQVVEIGPNSTDEGTDGGRTTAHRTLLRTEAIGVSGGVNACWVLEGTPSP
ncbi:hypothetical protein IWX64_002890 [Arthrobacter sp. CAN_A212]|uniref:DUF4307 domain-containing protein n=1 Tax=unclassified Arthrobacter TaxID=235627 RepID=UPI0018CB39DB|nr:DUF4307 domain-containing protein [Arthrobacter sp. CAN_C5]MBP2217810.1 hypothetical protein [Arthrobacter sp. CAN_C5]